MLSCSFSDISRAITMSSGSSDAVSISISAPRALSVSNASYDTTWLRRIFFKLCFFAAFSSVVSQVDLPCDLDQFVLDSDIKFFFIRHLADLRSFEILRKPKFQKRRGAGRRQDYRPAQHVSAFAGNGEFLSVEI